VPAGGSAINIAENFTFNGTMNFSTATLTIRNLLQEVGGAELVQGIPITLTYGGTDPDEGPFYSSPGSNSTKYRFFVKIQDPQQAKWTAHLRVDNAVIPNYPANCAMVGSNNWRTDLLTTYAINPASGPSLVVSTTQSWQCRDWVGGDPNKPSTLRAP
jgi:hypothetical protein